MSHTVLRGRWCDSVVLNVHGISGYIWRLAGESLWGIRAGVRSVP